MGYKLFQNLPQTIQAKLHGVLFKLKPKAYIMNLCLYSLDEFSSQSLSMPLKVTLPITVPRPLF